MAPGSQEEVPEAPGPSMAISQVLLLPPAESSPVSEALVSSSEPVPASKVFAPLSIIEALPQNDTASEPPDGLGPLFAQTSDAPARKRKQKQMIQPTLPGFKIKKGE